MGLDGQKHFGQSAQLNSAHASKIQEAAGCWLELETKVHPKVRNHVEGPY